jgi:hypothetical protein
MAFFECTIGGGGDGVSLIVSCSSVFAGAVITADNGDDVFTEVCPSVSPYTVKFEGIPTGTYTISGDAMGVTFQTTFTVLDYETNLAAIPDGATATPTDDITTLLYCAGIFDKNYTTISQVLADTTSLLAIISDSNAVDYLVRSTTWASDVCSDSTAMTYIGANNYCANTLLNDDTWRDAIVDSSYIESVLNVKVPTMTSNSSPSGQCSASSWYTYNNAGQIWYAFDGNDSTCWWTEAKSGSSPNGWIQYMFPNNVKVYGVMFINDNSHPIQKVMSLQASTTGSGTYDVLTNGEQSTPSGGATYKFSVLPNQEYKYYRLHVYSTGTISGYYIQGLLTLQFYGRRDV